MYLEFCSLKLSQVDEWLPLHEVVKAQEAGIWYISHLDRQLFLYSTDPYTRHHWVPQLSAVPCNST